MPHKLDDASRQHAALLADALSDTTAELRLIDPADLIGHIRGAQWASIADLIQTSAELYFREGALIFGCAGTFDLEWAKTPAIGLDLEFQWCGVSAFFTLVLGRFESLVDLKKVWFAHDPIDAAAGVATLAAAVADARLPLAQAIVRPASFR